MVGGEGVKLRGAEFLLDEEKKALRQNRDRSGKEKKEPTKYPKRVFLIVGNEFCERFSYYGMRTVLLLYFRNFLDFGDDDSTSVYHAFTMLAYFFPLVGGIISDSYWGKFKTIWILSAVYIAGHVFKTLAAIPHIPSRAAHIFLSCFGLLLIAFGTGGIKPCVSSFGGDQFKPDQVTYRKQFFSLFYVSINAGALLAKIVMPMIRTDLDCYPGEEGPIFEECYSVAFGLPGLLMIVATTLFLMGSTRYTKYKPSGSIFIKFCKCIYSACKNRWNTMPSQRSKEHWLDYADTTPRIIRDTKYVVAVLLIFSPLPLFWTLFDQQGSRWTLQALQMDRYWGSFLVKPEQMDTFNPLLIVALTPLFEVTLYPLLRRYKINFSPIRRMCAGLILAGLAFLVTAIVQFEIDKTLTPLPNDKQFGIRIINTAPCALEFKSNHPIFQGLLLNPNEVSDTQSNFIDVNDAKSVDLYFSDCSASANHTISVASTPSKIIDVVVNGRQGEFFFQGPLKTEQMEDGRAEVFFVNVGDRPLAIHLGNMRSLHVEAQSRSEGIVLPVGKNPYSVYKNQTSFESSKPLNASNAMYEGEVTIGMGGIYSVVLLSTADEARLTAMEHEGQKQIEDVNHFRVKVAWMIPQYFIITVAEIFLSITGLEFSYTQAPPSMKAVLTSFWHLTVSCGNVIVLILAQVKPIERQAHEFLLFSCLIWVASAIFMYLGYGYKPVDENEFANDDTEENGDGSQTRSTPGKNITVL